MALMDGFVEVWGVVGACIEAATPEVVAGLSRTMEEVVEVRADIVESVGIC